MNPNVMKVLALRRQGHTRSDIAALMELTLREVDALTKAGLDVLREQHKDIVDEAFLLHFERLEELYKLVSAKLSELTQFDDRVFKTALLILERQSRLLGLDRPAKKDVLDALGAARQHRSTPSAFLTLDATPAELIAEVESYGIRVPDRFKLASPSDTGTVMA